MVTIERQIRTLRESAEGWAVDHDDAMACREIEEAVAVARSLWALTKAALANRPPRGSDAEERALAERWREQFAAAAAAFAAVRAGADAASRAGYTVAGIDELAAAHAEALGVLAVPLDEVVRGHEQVRDGRVKPLREVRLELQRRAGG